MKSMLFIFTLLLCSGVIQAQVAVTSFPYYYNWTNPATFVKQVDGTWRGGGDGRWGTFDVNGVPSFVGDAAGFVKTNLLNADDVLFVYVDARGRHLNGTEYFSFDVCRSAGSSPSGTFQVYSMYTMLRSYNVATDLSTSWKTITVTLPTILSDSLFGFGIYTRSNVVINIDNMRFAGGSLPITLSSFNVSLQGSAAVLRWVTLSEIENYGYFIQRSEDGASWTDIPNSFQPGFGTTTESHSYSFTDNSDPTCKYYRLRQVDLDGTNHYSDPLSVTTSVEREPVPGIFALSQSYPNPFNPSTTIAFSLPKQARTSLLVYNLLGEVVATLNDGMVSAGEHTVVWEPANLPSGTYVYVLRAGEAMKVGKTVYMR